MGTSIDANAVDGRVDQVHGPRISVVLATYNRLDLLKHLLDGLAKQTLSSNRFEVIVVDDGSRIPVRGHVDPKQYPFSLTLLEQANAGPSAARHRGVLAARGDILVLLDDDMELPPGFLEEHLKYHARGRPTVVIGRYASDPAIGKKPIFDRYFGLKWDRLSSDIASGRMRVDGTYLATGNVSMRRVDYLSTGGLDASLQRAEDMALGLALEDLGVDLVFSDSAYSVHLSDHVQPEKWRSRAYLHGKLETRIARRHPTKPHADPWRYAFSLPMAGRVLCLGSAAWPQLGRTLADRALDLAEHSGRLGLEPVALRAAGLVYGIEYFRGMREEAGTITAMATDALSFLKKVAKAKQPVYGVPGWMVRVTRWLDR